MPVEASRPSRDRVFSDIVRASSHNGIPQSCIIVRGNRVMGSGYADGEQVISAIADACGQDLDLQGTTLYASSSPTLVEAQLIRDKQVSRVVVVDSPIEEKPAQFLEDYGITVEKGA